MLWNNWLRISDDIRLVVKPPKYLRRRLNVVWPILTYTMHHTVELRSSILVSQWRNKLWLHRKLMIPSDIWISSVVEVNVVIAKPTTIGNNIRVMIWPIVANNWINRVVLWRSANSNINRHCIQSSISSDSEPLLPILSEFRFVHRSCVKSPISSLLEGDVEVLLVLNFPDRHRRFKTEVMTRAECVLFDLHKT